MKSWTLSDELQARPDLAAAVEKLRPVLDRVLKARYRDEVDAAWSLAPAGGVLLRLADHTWPGGVEQRFRPADLDPGPDGEDLLRGVWIDLLGAGARAIIDRLLVEVEELEEVEVN